MIKDAQLVLSSDQAITTTNGVSTNVIDLGATGRDYGTGYPVFVYVVVKSVLDSATGGATFAAQLQESDAESSGFAVVATAGPIAHESLPAGTVLKIRIPDSNLRYLRINYVVSATMTTGTVDAFVGIER